MPIRNPFARRTAADETTLRPGSAGTGSVGDLPKLPSFERVDTVGSMASSSMSVRSRRSQDTGDYKMSVVNDSGVYLPPSPTSERDAFWSTSASANANGGHHPRRTYITSLSSSLSRSSTENPGSAGGPAAGRSSLGDTEPFSISRESFDSYRRSFDISAKSPIVAANEWGNGGVAGRQSLDSATATRRSNSNYSSNTRQSRLRTANLTDMSTSEQQLQQQQRFPPADEGFEDVGLDDGRQATATTTTNANNGGSGSKAASVASAFIRKRGAFFSKFGSDHAGEAGADTPANGSGSTAPVSRFLMSNRKRAQSGQGAELTPMDRNTSLPTPGVTSPEPQEVQS